ncbi:MAG TPA: hypothetical protein VJR89_18670, partial [Polyangiales bacterium]|nr:hypothetical protein [Polyangiales bacterium]
MLRQFTTLGVLGLLYAATACDSADAPHVPNEVADAARPMADPDTPETPEPLRFCARQPDDFVADVFCGESAPVIRNLQELQAALRVAPGPISPEKRDTQKADTLFVRFPILLGHSTALSGHVVSPLNPRALLMGIGTVVAFQRGVQRVEIATLARDRGGFNFYLLQFERACDAEPEGCSPVERFTARIERDWTSVRLNDAEDLKNTPLDCRQCHQRGRESAALLMRELDLPWTHFFLPLDTVAHGGMPGVQGEDLMRDYLEARGDEPYGNVDMRAYPDAAPLVLQTAAGKDQPLYFDAV